MINVSDHHTRVKANAQGSGAPPAPVMGCLLGSQSGRAVDISNSFEIEYTTSPAGEVVINEAFLARKQEQCARRRAMRGRGLRGRQRRRAAGGAQRPRWRQRRWRNALACSWAAAP
jgi:hypothetical protein